MMLTKSRWSTCSSSEESSCQPNLKWLLAHIDEPREVICQLSSLNEHFQHPHCFMTLMRTVHSDYLISKVEETLKHYLSPLLKTFPRSLFVVTIIKSHILLFLPGPSSSPW